MIGGASMLPAGAADSIEAAIAATEDGATGGELERILGLLQQFGGAITARSQAPQLRFEQITRELQTQIANLRNGN